MSEPRILVLPADDSACGHLRCIWPAEMAARQGLDVVVEDIAISVVRRGQWDPKLQRYPVTEIELPEADVVVVQRPLNIDFVEALELMSSAGIGVIVDLDDDFHSVHVDNKAYADCHPKTSPHENYLHLARAVAAADLVTVTTPALAACYGTQTPSVVLPNVLPANLCSVDVERAGPITIGWAGTVATHPDDLQVTRGAVGAVTRQTGAEFVVVGDGEGVADRLDLVGPLQRTGWVDFASYHRTLAETIGVGIVPLTDSVFNAAKSSLKALEFAALGIPVVASPSPDNRRVAVDGVCELAGRFDQWRKKLHRLVSDEGWRQERSEAGRAAVLDHHTVEAHGWRWAEVWAAAYEGVRGATLARGA